MVDVLDTVWDGIQQSLLMAYEVWWALVLGFAIAKSLFQKGASAASALAFQFASTNLVWELGLVLWVLIGWQFTLAEYVGGIVLIALMSLLLRLFVSPRLEQRAREHARHAQAGHVHHSMRAVAHNFRADWKMLWKEITLG